MNGSWPGFGGRGFAPPGAQANLRAAADGSAAGARSFEERRRIAFAKEATVAEDHDVIGEGQEVARDVGSEDQRGTALA